MSDAEKIAKIKKTMPKAAEILERGVRESAERAQREQGAKASLNARWHKKDAEDHARFIEGTLPERDRD